MSQRHAYTNFTGEPYIYYNGVHVNKPRVGPPNSTDHLDRSIIWPNNNGCTSIEQDQRSYQVNQSMAPQSYQGCSCGCGNQCDCPPGCSCGCNRNAALVHNCNYSANNFFR